MEDLFNKAGFVNYYYEDTCSFYRKFFPDEDSIQLFFSMVFKNDAKDKTPRRMMNQVVRWIELADDLAKLRPDRDPLIILCIRSCIESLCGLWADAFTEAKKEDEQKYFFENNLSVEGKKYILSSFNPVCCEKNGIEDYNYEFSISEFESMIYEVRNEAVHDGDYWSTQIFSRSRDVSSVASIMIKKDKKELIYETDIEYSKFIHYFVKASIRYIDKYLETKEN